MPSPKDNLARKFLDLEKRRTEGEFTALWRENNDPYGVSVAERNNWNVAAADMEEIADALRDPQPFRYSKLETEESTLDQINDAVRRMEAGDVSKYNHLPQFLREYYGRRAMAEVFGPNLELPPLDENLKAQLNQMTVRPEFRDALTRLIVRNAVDSNSRPIVDRLREYETYLNGRMLADTINPVSEEEANRIRQKYPGEKGEKMLADNLDRQCFIAKSLFMTQLGRIDLTEEDGSRHPYHGSVAELFSHGSRVAFNLPHGEKADQDLVYDAWRKSALNSGVLFKGRFASHEMHRQQVDAEGNLEKPFSEIRLRWKKQLLRAQVYKKVTTYVGNYGMNIPMGGMGRRFNRTDAIDDQGSFGHLYVRTRKGDATHSGSILMGFENAQPKKESCIGQLHNFNAFSHDLSAFYSSRATFGMPIGGREANLSHMKPADLAGVLTQFELAYKTLQARSKTDPAAARKLTALNQTLCGSHLSAQKLANLMTSLGVEKRNAVRCVNAARNPKDANYTAHARSYRRDLYEVEPDKVNEPDPDMPKATLPGRQYRQTQPLTERGRDKYQRFINKNLQTENNEPRKNLVAKLSRVIAAHYLKELNKPFDSNMIDKWANYIRNAYAIDRQKTEDITAALSGEDAARHKGIEMRDRLYRVPADRESDYCDSMKRLLNSMVDPKGHSEAYQKLYQCVKSAAHIGESLSWRDPDQRASALMEANLHIIDAVNDYTSGKERTRSTLKGINTFDSALDAAACVQRFVPGVRLRTDTLIADINKARKPQERLAADALTTQYGKGVNRNAIDSWEKLAAVKNPPAQRQAENAPVMNLQ